MPHSYEQRSPVAPDHRHANEVVVLKKEMSIPYTIPSFPVFTALLRKVRLQWEDSGGERHEFDGFMRECGLLSHPIPAVAVVEHGYENAYSCSTTFFCLRVGVLSAICMPWLVSLLLRWLYRG